MLFTGELLGAYIGGALYLLFVFLTGKLVTFLIDRRFPASLLTTNSSSIYIGMLLVPVLFAIIKTGGSTILLGFILVIVFLISGYKRLAADHVPVQIERVKRDIVSMLLYYSIFYIFLAFYVATNFYQNGNLYQCLQDVIYQLDITEALKNLGAENGYAQLNYFNDYASLRQPYHYFEFWFIAFINQFSGVNTFFLTIATAPAILFAVSAFFVKNIASVIGLPEKASFFAPALIFLKLVFLFHFLTSIDVFTPALIPSLKSQVYLFFIYYALLVYLHAPRLSIIPLLGLLFSNISSVFSIFSLAGFAILVFLSRREYKNAWFILACTFLSGFFILAFYYINGFVQTVVGGGNSSGSVLNLNSLNYRTMINIVGGAGLQNLVLLLPWVVAFFVALYFNKVNVKVVLNKGYVRLLLCAAISAVGGLLAWALFYKTADSVQFFSNASNTLISALLVFTCLLVFKALYHRPRVLVVSLVPLLILFGIAVYQNLISSNIVKGSFYDYAFCKQVKEDTDEMKSSVGGYFMRNIKGDGSIFEANKKIYWRGGSIKLLKQDFSLVTLNIHKIRDYNWSTLDSGRISIYVKESPLYQQAPDMLEDSVFDYNRHILNFVVQNNIRFIIAEKEAEVPLAVLAFFNRQSFSDPVTGLRYYAR
jgi:hypothetical protein